MKSKPQCYIEMQMIMNSSPLFLPENQILRDEYCNSNKDQMCRVNLSNFYLQAFILNGIFIRWNWRPFFNSKFNYLASYHLKEPETPKALKYWELGHGQKNDPWNEFK